MQRSLGLSLLLVVGAVAAASTGAAVVAASSEYDISVDGAVDTPTETVTVEGDTFEIDEVGVVGLDDPIGADVTSPDKHSVLLYNTDNQTVDRDLSRNADDDRVRFDPDVEPGTYTLWLESAEDNERKALTPVVVEGYDLSLEYDSSVAADETVTVEATAEPKTDLEQPDEVEVRIWDGETATELTLEHAGGTTYETTTSLSGLEPGTYDVYGAVPGDEEVDGYDSLLAVEDGRSLTVTEAEDDEGEDENGGTIGGGDDPGNETDDGDGNETDDADDAAGNETDDEDAMGNETDGDEPGDGTAADNETEPDGSEGSDSSEADADESDADDESETDVIEPNENEPDAAESDESGADDIGNPTGVLAALAIGAVLVAVVAGRIDR